MVGFTIALPIKEDDLTRRRLIAVILPLSSVLKPLYAVDAACKFRDHTCVDIAALIGTLFHTPVEAVPRSIGLTAYIAYLRQRNRHGFAVPDRDTVQHLRPKGIDFILDVSWIIIDIGVGHIYKRFGYNTK